MIVVNIIGGLGNQMFQYALGRTLSLSRGQELKLDIFSMDEYKLRKFDLFEFSISASIAEKADIPKRKKTNLDKIKRIFGSGPRQIDTVKEKNFTFEESILNMAQPAYYRGYWQSYKYFEKIEGTIRSDFSLSAPLSPARQAMLRDIKNTNHSVSLHVRRGDYVSNPAANAHHGTCEPGWYEAAIKKMTDRFGDVSFYVFSDDPNWAKENIHSSSPMVFVEPQQDRKDAEDLHLMAGCHSHIIANSTFSWWGAWLNSNFDKHVIAPSRWFKTGEHDTRDLIPTTWERL